MRIVRLQKKAAVDNTMMKDTVYNRHNEERVGLACLKASFNECSSFINSDTFTKKLRVFEKLVIDNAAKVCEICGLVVMFLKKFECNLFRPCTNPLKLVYFARFVKITT